MPRSILGSSAPDPTHEWIAKTLLENGDLNFVQRLLSGREHPRISIGQDAQGNQRYATHQMAWEYLGPGEKVIGVFPNVVYDERSKSLKWLNPEQAREHAWKTKQFIRLDSEQQADILSSRYKEVLSHLSERGTLEQGSQSMNPPYEIK